MSKYGVISGSNTGKYGPEITHSVVVKETWNIRTDYGKMEKLIKHNMAVQYHEKRV